MQILSAVCRSSLINGCDAVRAAITTLLRSIRDFALRIIHSGEKHTPKNPDCITYLYAGVQK